MHRLKFRTATAAAVAALALGAGPVAAATITGWNTGNVEVGATPAEGVTGYSVVYDRLLPDAGAVSNGRIAFTPPEAVSPGIKVQPEDYTQGGPGGITLDGCIMTSNPGAVCTSEFQSGKRVKQQMTGFGPLDLVFDVEGSEDAVYQVFHRLINLTGQPASGFVVELGFGIGDDFVLAGPEDGIAFSSAFRAPGSGGAPVSSQFPFGLFGDASDNPNFTLDGFFAPERTGFDLSFSDNQLVSTGYFGPYPDLFGDWLSQESVPEGAFWDNDNDPSTDALLMAWLNYDGLWELRRDVLDAAAGTAESITAEFFADYDALSERLGLGALLVADIIEDLANLNVNFAIDLGDLGDRMAFTLRTTLIAAETAPIPLPATAPLLAAAFGLAALARRRRTA